MSDNASTVLCIGECMVEFSRAEQDLWRQGFAGDTLNVAWACRALLPDDSWQVQYLTRLGDDRISEQMLAFFNRVGIGTTFVQRDSERTAGLYTIETDDAGERSFTYWRSDSAARGLADDLSAIDTALEQSALVYLSGISLAILPQASRQALIERLSQPGRHYRLAFDPNIRQKLWRDADTMRDAIGQMAAAADIVLPTFDDERLAFADPSPAATLARYRELDCREIVVKNGVEATLYQCADAEGQVEVQTPMKALDTTGAGDGFNGVYLAKRLLGHSCSESIRAAQAAAARIVMRRGALIPYELLVR